ncbi:MAG: hypothetical protein KF716_27260, partial [Anaerolineae bacterium]|nr:hypothetical protein [Anaerolineae bacterium]
GQIQSFPTGVTARNFIIRVTFTNPYDGSDPNGDKWDYGIIFRQTGTNREYRLVMLSDLGWFLVWFKGSVQNYEQRASSEIPQGALNLGAGETNTFELVINGETGYFFLNGYFVSDFPVTDKMDSGKIILTIGNFDGYERSGARTDYSDLEIITLP